MFTTLFTCLQYNNPDKIEMNPILSKPIQSLEVSYEFKRMARANGFNTLSEILDKSVDDLHKLEYSGYRMLKELYNVLEKENLGYLLND